MNYLYFFILYFLLFFTGRGLGIFASMISKNNIVDQKILNSNAYIFYPVITLFFLGNIAVLTNFFFPMNNVRNLIFIVCLLINLLNFKYKLLFDYKDFIISNIIIPTILVVSSYNTWLHYDAGLYHLNNQLWINESKIVFGLGNFNIWFSWSSLYEYISSYFWLNENLILLHYLNLIFLSLFYSFLYFQISKKTSNFLKYSSLNVLFFGLLDNFGIQGGGNGFLYIQTIGKPDLAFTVIFYITFVLFINSIIKKDYEVSNFITLLYLSLFSIQLKAFGFYILPLVFYFLYKLPEFKIIFLKVKTLIVLAFIWLIKNVIISGCLIFPINLSCFSSLSWYKSGKSEFALSVLSDQHIAYKLGSSLQDWFNIWFFHGKNMQIYGNFMMSISILLVLNFILFNLRKSSHRNLNMWIKIYILIITVSWLTSAPNSRFGMIVLLMVVSTLKIQFKERKFTSKILNNKILILAIFFICIIATPRGYAYRDFLTSPFILTQVNSPSQNYVLGTNEWAVYPDNGDNKCWVNIKCMDIDRLVYKSYLNNYLLFESEDSKEFK